MISNKSKLFIKVNGVIGSRKRICTFCNNTIEGAEKVVETTRKLRCGPYFPQLAYLQSAVGKIDTLGRAVVCLSCFHQLLRQWSMYEQKHVPLQKRKYSYISDKGVKNYEETRALEIRSEAEKRAFAIQTKQEHIVKKSFDKLTKILDNEEYLIKKSEERIIELQRELSQGTKGEHWKINREIKKEKRLIKAAEFRIEVTEDKEEEIRNQTIALLEVYRSNKSLFRSTSEPNLLNKNNQLIAIEKDIDCLSENEQENLPPDSLFSDSVDGNPLTMNKGRKQSTNSDKYDTSSDLGYHTIVQTIKTEELSDDGYGYGENDRNDVNSVGVCSGSRTPRGNIGEEHEKRSPSPEWHLVKEFVHPVVSKFPEDEWSKLFVQQQQRETEHQVPSSEHVYRDDNWNLQNYASPEDGDLKHAENKFSVQREKIFSEETDSDTEEEKEQVYEVNPEEWSSSSSSDIAKRNAIPKTDYDHGKFTTNNSWNNKNDHVVETTQMYSTSNEVSTDIWDNIQIEEAQENASQTQTQFVTQQTAKDENYIDEYDQEIIVSRNEKDILSPGRLDTSRFSEFTKSSYTPKTTNKQLPRTEKYQDNTTYTPGHSVEIQRSKKQTDVTIIEDRNNHISNHGTKSFHGRNESIEPVRNHRNTYERHLSKQKEEWERKHLSPSRLDESTWFSFLDEYSNNNVKKSESNVSSSMHQNDVGHIKERNERSNKHSDSSDTSIVNKQANLHLERSPTTRKFARQDDVVQYEQPVQKMTTKASLQSDPWDDIDRKELSQNSKAKTVESNRLTEDISAENNKGVRRLNLKQWSFDVEKTRRSGSSSDEEANNLNIEHARSEGHFKEHSLRGDRVFNENTSFKKQTTTSSQMKKVKETVIIEGEERPLHDDVGYFSKKPVGKLNLNLWTQNDSPQFNMNCSSGISKLSPVHENKNDSFNPRTMRKPEVVNDRSNSYKVEDGEKFVNGSRSIKNSRLGSTNQSSNSSPQPNNLKKDSVKNKRSLIFNQSMSEDELAWEKRFSKSNEKNSSEDLGEDHEIQTNDIEIKSPRLVDENDNHLDFGKIVLDEEEVRRVRNGGQTLTARTTKVEKTTTTSILQSEPLKYDDLAQLSEEEKAWEKKISTPGKLNFSKFSHFT